VALYFQLGGKVKKGVTTGGGGGGGGAGAGVLLLLLHAMVRQLMANSHNGLLKSNVDFIIVYVFQYQRLRVK
jgi:hypothetical protein